MNTMYKKIIQDSDIGYSCYKLIYDCNSKTYLYKPIEVNKAFERYTGLNSKKIIGYKLKEVLPDKIELEFDLLDEYRKKIKNMKNKSYEKYFPVTDKTCRIEVSLLEEDTILISCKDLTESRKELLERIEKCERVLWQVIDSIPLGIFWKDKEFKYLGSNKKFVENTGFSREEIIGKDDYEIEWKGLVAIDSFRSDDQNVLKREQAILNKEQSVIDRQGNKRWVKVDRSPLYCKEKEIYGLLGVVEDITDKKKLEKDLRKTLLRHEQVARRSRSIVWEIDKDGLYTYISPVIKEIIGYDPDEIIGKTCTNQMFEKSEYLKFKKKFLSKIEKKQNIVDVEIELTTKDNKKIWLLTNGFPVYDNEGIFLLHRGVSIDITSLKENEERIRYLSFRDQLTGLYNRRFFEEELERLDTKRNLPLTIAVIDVDRLKLVNDAFGHKTGDLLLKKICKIMEEECRADDIISRVGGDEFTILLPKTSLEEADELMKRITKRINKERLEAIDLSLSYGCESKTSTYEKVEDIFKKADIKMYNYKNAKSEDLNKSTIEGILEELFKQRPEEKLHSKSVSELSAEIGKALGFSDLEVEKLKTTGKFHDIGKIILSKDILTKKGKLQEDEWEEVKRHPELGYIISSYSDKYRHFAKDVLYHHERYDGKGYPKGLKGKEIPINSRILALADAFNIIMTDRPYKKAVSKDEAIDIILEQAGKQFDPEIVEVFIKSNIVENYKNR